MVLGGWYPWRRGESDEEGGERKREKVERFDFFEERKRKKYLWRKIKNWRREKKYGKDWKRSTVCTFISHLISKGYVSGRREGRVFFYSSAVNDKKFREEQARQFLDFWFHGSISEFAEAAFRAKKVSKKEAAEVLASIDKLETR